LGTISAFAFRHGETKKKTVTGWPVAGPSGYWLLASSPASQVKTTNVQTSTRLQAGDVRYVSVQSEVATLSEVSRVKCS